MTPDDVKALQTAYDASTQGEWLTRRTEVKDIALCSGRNGLPDGKFDVDQAIADASFIALAHNAMPALLQHVARLEDENRRLYSCVEFVASRHPDGNPKFAIEAAQELLASLAPTAAAPGGEVVG